MSSELASTSTPTVTILPAEKPTLEATPSLTPVGTPTLGLNQNWRRSRIAFASNRNGSFQIYLMRPDGSELTQFTSSIGDNLSPAWSLDAKKIAFVSSRVGNSEIYVMNFDGTEQINVTEDASKDYMPIWIPRSRIAFISDRQGQEQIYVMEADGTNLQPMIFTYIDSPAKFFCLTWLGEGIVSYTVEEDSERQVRIVDTSTGGTTTPAILNNGFDRSCPLWPMLVKNLWIVLVSNRSGQDEIYKYNPDREEEQQVTIDSSGSLGITRSADEEWITLYSHRTGNWDVFLARTLGIGTENQWNITSNPADDIQPAWEPY